MLALFIIDHGRWCLKEKRGGGGGEAIQALKPHPDCKHMSNVMNL